MADRDIRGAVVRYGVLAGPVTGVLLAGVAVLASFPLELLGFILLGIPLFIVPAIVGVSDIGIETASSGALVGASSGDPGQYQTGSLLPVPNKLEVVCWLSGVAVVGAVLLAAA